MAQEGEGAVEEQEPSGGGAQGDGPFSSRKKKNLSYSPSALLMVGVKVREQTVTLKPESQPISLDPPSHL